MSQHQKRVVLLVAALFMAVGGTSPASSCCMVPLTYPGDVDQSRQDGIVLFHDGREVLLVRVAPTFPDFDYGPDRMAWIVTVPNKPDHYAAIEPEVFTETQQLYYRLRQLASKQRPYDLMPTVSMGSDSAVASKSALIIDEVVAVGPYEITPVQAPGPGGAQALNDYLDQRGFPAESLEELEWFTSRDFTFLCVEVRPENGATKFAKNVELPALQISFASEAPYYPARYSARQGNFALGLTVVTSEPLARDSLREMQWQLAARTPLANLFTTKPLPAELSPALAQLPGNGDVERWYVNPIISRGFNRADDDEFSIHTWSGDVTMPIGDSSDGPPSWYSGDGPRSVWQSVQTHQDLVVVVSVLSALVTGFVVWLRSRVRSRGRRPLPRE
ncbi:MAG: DUF2330 domain-containing protein [Planctomycetota bacterium]